MGGRGRDGVERRPCGRCGRIAEEPSPGAGLRRVPFDLRQPWASLPPGAPVVLCDRCHEELSRAGSGKDLPVPGGDDGDGAARRLSALLDHPPLASLLPVIDAGGRAWSSFHFACGNCPRTIPSEEARGRVLEGGAGALALEVAAPCPSCGHVTPYQVVFHDGGVPRFHPDRAVPDPRGPSSRRH